MPLLTIRWPCSAVDFAIMNTNDLCQLTSHSWTCIYVIELNVYIIVFCRFNWCVLLHSIRPLLLDCPSKEVRTAFYNILGTTIHNYYNHKLHIEVSCCWIIVIVVMLYILQQQSDSTAVIIEQLLTLLNKEVVESFRTCTEFFNFFQMLCTQVLYGLLYTVCIYCCMYM